MYNVLFRNSIPDDDANIKVDMTHPAEEYVS